MPAAVNGDFLKVYNQRMDEMYVNVVGNATGFQGTAWQKFIDDFLAARTHLELQVKIKFDFLSRPPWKLAILGHHSEVVARDGIRELHAHYAALSAEQRQVHHPLMQLVFDELECEVAMFMHGAPLVSQPGLSFLSAKLALVPLVERNIEREHAQIKQTVKTPRHSPILVSLARRLPMFEKLVQERPETLAEVAIEFDEARSPHILEKLNISRHPEALVEFDSLVREGKDTSARSNDARFRLLNAILYRCSLHDQFHPAQDLQASHRQAALEDVRRELAALPAIEKDQVFYARVLGGGLPNPNRTRVVNQI